MITNQNIFNRYSIFSKFIIILKIFFGGPGLFLKRFIKFTSKSKTIKQNPLNSGNFFPLIFIEM